MENKLVIYGSKGLAKEIHQVVEDLQDAGVLWEFLGFLDDDTSRHGEEIHGYPVLGDSSWLKENREVNVCIGIGSCLARKSIYKKLKKENHSNFATLIHPRAWVGNRVSIGTGTVILAGVSISTDIDIGEHVVVNKNSVIGHDVKIEAFSNISPNASISGKVEIGCGAFIGANATILQGLKIGAEVIIGAGSVVTKDMGKGVKAIGVPAKPVNN